MPIEDILEELARPDEAIDPASVLEAFVENNPEIEPLDNLENNALVNEETIEEFLVALDLEPKEEPDSGDTEPVAEVSEIVPLVEQSSSLGFAPVFI